MARRGSFEVTLEGRGVVTLREADYVASGGEGAIYRTGQTGVKLYTDTAKMARDGVAEKIKLLAGLKHSGIVAPQGLVLDAGKKPIGFYMPFIAGGEPMSRVFVSDFRAEPASATPTPSPSPSPCSRLCNTPTARKRCWLTPTSSIGWR